MQVKKGGKEGQRWWFIKGIIMIFKIINARIQESQACWGGNDGMQRTCNSPFNPKS